MQKDLPLLRKLSGLDFKAALLKGRQHYLCTTRLNRAFNQQGDLFNTTESMELERIEKWAKHTRDGTITDWDVPPPPKVWAQVCSEPHTCSPRTCPPSSGCFYQAARRRIQSADVVVLNHTLFFMLLAMNNEFGDTDDGLIFPHDMAILDEAHTIENIAAQQLGYSVSDYDLRFLLQRLYNPKTRRGLLVANNVPDLLRPVADLQDHADAFFKDIAERCRFRPYSKEFRVRQPEIVNDTVGEEMARIESRLKEVSKDIEDEAAKGELMDAASRLEGAREAIKVFLTQNEPDHVYWVEQAGREGQVLRLQANPATVGEQLRDLLFRPGARSVLTSATLAVSPTSLDYFCNRVGAESARQVQIGSPFDYETQMKLYLVRSMPDPREAGFEDGLEQWISFLLKETNGSAFVLFTSYRVLRAMAERLEPLCKQRRWPLYVQGQGMPRSRMLAEFKKNANSVLFGTESFWAGVDVPGDRLVNVIITRLPFAVPDHPMIEARLEAIQRDHGDSFQNYSLPEAILKLRQGVGRLIRSRADRGHVAILDNRILSKPYGKAFLNALPECPVELL
jgi:ATP-dependent DNA helicase DinG